MQQDFRQNGLSKLREGSTTISAHESSLIFDSGWSTLQGEKKSVSSSQYGYSLFRQTERNQANSEEQDAIEIWFPNIERKVNSSVDGIKRVLEKKFISYAVDKSV